LLDVPIYERTVDIIFDDLRYLVEKPAAKLDVIVNSQGGNIHAAYNLALFLRRCTTRELNFIVPRSAKSAATLLVCAGNAVYMGPIAELGPIDTTVTIYNRATDYHDRFSPLDVEEVLGAVMEDFLERENENVVGAFLQHLPHVLMVFGMKNVLDIPRRYLVRLLATRMIYGEDVEKRVKSIIEALVESCSDSSFCIDIYEARAIGLIVEDLAPEELSLVWDIYRLVKDKEQQSTSMIKK
jgi:hypothetical protein